MCKLQKSICLALLAALMITGCSNTPVTNSNNTQKETTSEIETEISTDSTTESESESSANTSEGESETTMDNSEAESETTMNNSETTTESESSSSSDSTPNSEKPSQPEYTYSELDKTMYVKSSVNVRSLPHKDGIKVGSLSKGKSVHVTGQCNETKWYRIDYNGKIAYVSNSYLSDTKPTEQTTQSNSNSSNKNDDYPDHLIISNSKPATPEELSAYTFTEMNVIMYPTNRMTYWRLPRTDMEFYCDNANSMGWTMKYVPTKVTGICKETGAYRLEVDGVTVFVSGNKGAFGEDPFVSTIPVATKSNPGYKAGTPEWHAYWDGTTMGEYYVTTGEDLWMVVKPIINGKEALAYSGSYPNDYVIGSYAEITVNGFKFKGEY